MTRTADTTTSTIFNNFYFGRPNNVGGYIGEAYIDEVLFWDELKANDFIEELYVFYDNYLALRFHTHSSFLVLADSTFESVEPVKQCQVRVHTPNTPHPCRLECMWSPWCGSVLVEGRWCRYYNVFSPQNLTATSANSMVFVKVY